MAQSNNKTRVPVLLMAEQLGSGGTERQLAETAMMLDQSRFEPWVASMRPGFLQDDLRRAGVGLIELPMRSFLSADTLTQGARLWRELRQKRIQLVHTFDFPMTAFGVPVARLAGVPAVLSSQRAHRDLVPARFRRLLRWTDKRVEGIVVNCEAMREHMIHDEGARPELLHVCYNAMDVSRFPYVPRQAGAEVVIGIICRLRAEKNITTLISAFAKLKQPSKARLLIVGSGPDQAVLQQQVEQLGIAGRVRFEPETKDVAAWLGRMDVFVLPSLSEALSNSLMEAMATGAACVASNVGGNPELVIAEKTGLLFPPTDADALRDQLERLIHDPEMRGRLAATGAARIRESFSREAARTCMTAVYEAALSQRSR